jgi:hypothetical protein
MIQSHTITATANPAEGGTITGAGNYNYNSTVNLVASPNAGYSFANWTENGVEVSPNPTYSFTATVDRYLDANFSIINSIIIATVDNYKFNVFPNPASDILNVSFLENDNINDKIVNIYMFNTLGKTVSVNYKLSAEGVFIVPVSNIPTGIYLIDVWVNHKSIGKGRVIIIK